MEIAEHRDHSREKRAECCIGEDLDDEVNVEGIEDKGGVVHSGKEEGRTAQPGQNRKK